MYSFDIFDTCICRFFNRPADLFLALAKRVYDDCGLKVNDKAIRKLQKHRVLAELSARSLAENEDILLSDIYHQLGKMKTIKIDLSRMMQLEIELEMENVQAIQESLQLFNELKRKNRHIVFISDIYLPSEIVFKMLDKCGFEISGVSIYISGEIGLTKRTGRLFDYVVSKEDVQASQVVHYGDNVHSDIHMARKCGIQAHLLGNIYPLTRYEKQLTNIYSVPSKFVQWINRQTKFFRPFLYHNTCKYTINKELTISFMAAISRSTRLFSTKFSGEDNDISIISSFLAAPLIISFVYWVLKEAEHNGTTQLYFISRNGQIFYKVAKLICKKERLGINCYYLYGSRSAWYPAAMYDLDDYFFSILRTKYRNNNILQILRELQFNDNEINYILNEEGYSANDAVQVVDVDNVEYFFKNIKKNGRSQRFIDKFSSNRKIVNQYLSQEGFKGNKHTGIVDVGWHLSSHLALYRILSNYTSAEFTGYYLGIDKTHEIVRERSPYKAFIENTETSKNNWLFKLGAMTLLEDIFLAGDHGSVVGYKHANGEIEPIFSTSNYNYNDTVARIQNDVIYATKLSLKSRTLSDFAELSEDIVNILHSFYKYPRDSEVKSIAQSSIFARVVHDNRHERVLATQLYMQNILTIIWRTLFYKKDVSPTWMWFEGSVAISNWHVRILGRPLSVLNQLVERFEK